MNDNVFTLACMWHNNCASNKSLDKVEVDDYIVNGLFELYLFIAELCP